MDNSNQNHETTPTRSNNRGAELLRAVEAKFGRPIFHLSDSKDLAEEIFRICGQMISYNTLRRAYGLVNSSGGISQKTKDILASYLGYSNYEEFSRLPYQRKQILEHQQMMRVLRNDFDVFYAEQLLLQNDANNMMGLSYLLKSNLLEGKHSNVQKILHKALRLRFAENHFDLLSALSNTVLHTFLLSLEPKKLNFYLNETDYPDLILAYYQNSVDPHPLFKEHIIQLYRTTKNAQHQCHAAGFIALWSLLFPDFKGYTSSIKEYLKSQTVNPGSVQPLSEARLFCFQHIQNAQTSWEEVILEYFRKRSFKSPMSQRMFLAEMASILFSLNRDDLLRNLIPFIRSFDWQGHFWIENGLNQAITIIEAYFLRQDGNYVGYLKQKQNIRPDLWHPGIERNLSNLHQKLESIL